MNVVNKAVRAMLTTRHLRAAREARTHFLQHYAPAEAQQLLDKLHNTWHLNDTLDNDAELRRIYTFYKHLSLLLAAEYTLLKEGQQWLRE